METLNLHLALYTPPATGPRFPRHNRFQESPATVAGKAPEAHVVLRTATLQDGPAVAELAELDAARRPEGAVLVAEVDGDIVAALPVDGGRAFADPFRPTAHLVDLLALRLELTGADEAPARHRHGLLPRLRRPHLAA
jgi:hypothetical protein